MRWGGALLLIAFLLPVVAAKDGADVLLSEASSNTTIERSGAQNIGQLDDINANKEKRIHEGEGFKNDVGENHEMDSSKAGTHARDEPLKLPKSNENSTTKSSPETDLSQDSLVKECYPSHRCIIEKKKFIACLRVPGQDSLALSLLMDNKGMSPLDISIVGPDYVNLDETTFKLNTNQPKEVIVTIGDAVNDTKIILKVAEETCNLNLHSTITREAARVMPMRLTSKFVLVPVVVLLVMAGICIKLRRKRKQDGGHAYQKLDAELPVSTGGKKESDHSDQWDNSWGDDWDDEEAPLTPSKPMPNPSSKGLASRRSTKDGWKD